MRMVRLIMLVIFLKIRRLIFQKITQQIYFKFEKRNICVPINYYFVFKKTPYV